MLLSTGKIWQVFRLRSHALTLDHDPTDHRTNPALRHIISGATGTRLGVARLDLDHRELLKLWAE